MLRRFLPSAALVALALTAGRAGAQPAIVVGTDPSFASEYTEGPIRGGAIGQTFIAAGPQLNRLTVWFRGGTRSALDDDFFSLLWIVEGPTRYVQDGPVFLFESNPISQRRDGATRFAFNDPLDLVVGNEYSFHLFANNCGGPTCFNNVPVPVTGSLRGPSLQTTIGDAYDGGTFLVDGGSETDPNRDIRFEMVYGVPEPSTLGLLVVAVLGIVGVAARRRGIA